eukprot:jgi/Picsp_1/2781/NSC_01008-R1_---NA---
MKRKLLDHCSGSDTLLGSANVGASIFILLMLGYIAGIGSSVIWWWWRQRKTRAIDMEYRERFKDKPQGELPDVEVLVKSAIFPNYEPEEENEEGSGVDSSGDEGVNSPKSFGRLLKAKMQKSLGPLENGSISCQKMSIEGSASCLLRSMPEDLAKSRDFSLEEGGVTCSLRSCISDPESPIPNIIGEKNLLTASLPCHDETTDDKGDLIRAFKRESMQQDMFSSVKFEEGSRLDNTASRIIAQSELDDFQSKPDYAAPFKNAWEKELQGRQEKNRACADSIPSTIPDDRDLQSEERDRKSEDISVSIPGDDSKKISTPLEKSSENPCEEPNESFAELSTNPFATTNKAMDAARSAISEMSGDFK